ncbi:MAG: Mur ligase family protein [Candidatus Berkelbacteria bacterium]|nr:Mur ligase family protein [Candidatus Berkelbacteria bacterium]
MQDIREKILWWAVRRRVEIDRPYIIAVTGSIAKTSTKAAIGAVLRRAFPGQVRVGFGNLNSFLGVPLAILNFKVDFYRQKIGAIQWLWILKLAIWRGSFSKLPKYLVLEYGADYPGDIEQLAAQLPIDGAIITLVGPAHLANYPSLEALVAEKAKILDAVKPGGWALVNKNDPYLRTLTLKDCPSEMIDTATEDIAVNFARAVGQKLKIGNELIEEALSVMPRPAGRLQLKDLGAIKLLDDSYNANPLSMPVALKLLSKLPGRKVAILGDMLELGSSEVKYHQEIGQLAKQSADLVIGVGELAKEYGGAKYYPNAGVAAREISELLGQGDSILVKGSHGVHMEVIVKAIEKTLRSIKG